MFGQVFIFVLSGFVSVCNLARHFVLDSTLGITFFHFCIFSIFVSILLHVINYIKSVTSPDATLDELRQAKKEYQADEYKRYQKWLRRNAR